MLYCNCVIVSFNYNIHYVVIYKIVSVTQCHKIVSCNCEVTHVVITRLSMPKIFLLRSYDPYRLP